MPIAIYSVCGMGCLVGECFEDVLMFSERWPDLIKSAMECVVVDGLC